MRNLPMKLKAFLVTIYILACGSLYIFFIFNYIPLELPNYSNILFFTLLSALTESITVPFYGFSFSTSFAIHLASYILFGPLAAIITVILGFSFRVLKINGNFIHILNTPLYKTLFNYSVLLISMLYANLFFKLSGGQFPLENIEMNFIPIVLFCIIYFLLNTFIISKLFSILNNKSVLYFFINDARLGLLNVLAMAPFGVILAFIFNSYKYIGVLLFIFPIALARYTFSIYIESKSKYIQTVNALMRAIEARDKYTEGHSQRVSEITRIIAKELKYGEWEIEQLTIAALLHDVGKIGIDDHILNKTGKLTAEEYDIIKTHPEIGYNILKDIKDLERINNIVRFHHERFDGKGYPLGKKANELGLDVFIVQLADSIDAMATDRPYRKALSQEEIIEQLEENKGTQFHPDVVDAYLKALKKLQK